MYLYSFMERSVMKKIDIPMYVKRKYGIKIESLLNRDFFMRK